MSEVTLSIDHPAGLHLRPARMFFQTASGFKSTIYVMNLDRDDTLEVDAKSLFEIMRLGVSRGHHVRVRAEGDDADDAIAALSELVARNFGEPRA